MFKRFLFEGEIIEIADEILNDDLKYWNDNEFRHYIESEKHRYAKIKIIRTLYDYNVRSDNVDPRIWGVENANKDVYELDSAMESSIRAHVQESK